MRYEKSLAAVLIAVLTLLGVLLFSIYRDVKAQVVRDLNAQQAVHAAQAARGIQEHMGQIIATLDFLAHLRPVIVLDGEGKRLVGYYGDLHADEIKGVTRVDAAGRIVYTFPYMAETIGRDISSQAHVREILKTHEPAISDVFMAVQGFRAVAVHVPVFDAGKFAGTLAFLLSFDAIAKSYIENIRIGTSGYAWVLSAKGFEISCPVPGHVGKSVFEVASGFPEVLSVARRMLQGENGVTTYHLDRSGSGAGRGVLNHAVFQPIPIAKTFWSIVVATPEQEVLSSMEGFRLKFLFITFSLLAAGVACTYLLARAGIVAREQRKRETIGKALAASEALYTALIETTDTGFVVIDDHGEVLDANQEYVRLTGRKTLAEVRGVSVLEWTAPYEKERNANAVADCLRDGLIRNLALDYVSPGGKITSVEINATVVEREGSTKILSLCRDVTERKKLELQLAQALKMESVGRLAGGVAHDFNNMLNVINGYAEMALLKLAPSNPLHRNFQEILRAGTRSADLTRQLLAFARRQVANPKTLDLNEVVPSMLKMLQRLIGENITLAWQPGHDVWSVRVDPTQVDQILANLVVNAKDAISGVGRVTIETGNEVLDGHYCRTHVGATSGEYVRLTVSDNGCGMTAEVLSHVFEPFFTTKPPGEGTGLGLATVYGIVKQNNGYIDIYSELNLGTTFRIFLPRFRGGLEQDEPEKPRRTIPRGTETVLLVEDDNAVLELSRGMLESLGYNVLTAAGPAEAVAFAERHAERIHLLVSDVVMPQMNGKELYQCLKQIRPDAKCLFMSGYTADVIAHHGILEDGVHFIQKPYSVRALAEKVREALEGASGVA